MPIQNIANVKSKFSDSSRQSIDVTNYSNENSVSNTSTDIEIKISANETWASPDNNILITTVITNNTSEDIVDARFYDGITNGGVFKDGSVKIDEQEYPEYNSTTGFTLPNPIDKLGGTVTVTYLMSVEEGTSVTEINNDSSISFQIDSKQYELHSDKLTIKVINNSIVVTKTADVIAVKSGDQITYTITIENKGEIENTDVIFTDTIPTGTTFIPNSVKVDGQQKTDVSPADGITLENLTQGKTITLEFAVIVD